MVNLMTEHDVSKRLNVNVAWLRRMPRGSRGVISHDRSDPCSSNRHGRRPIGRWAEKSSYCMPWTVLLGIRNHRAASLNRGSVVLGNDSVRPASISHHVLRDGP